MSGKFFAVGVGPGDPELLTIKAVNTIKKCDVIAVPKSGANTNIALKIAEDYVSGKEIMECEMPMTKDEEKLNLYHDKSADDISKILDKNKSVAFLTLGDPTVYSTVMYIHKRLTKKGYNTNIVPGITSFCAAAAALNRSLCERDEMLHVIPATYTDVDYAVSLDGCKVLMKSGKHIMDIKEKLKDKNAMMVECATMENEKIYTDLQDLKEKSGYFSTIIIPKSNM